MSTLEKLREQRKKYEERIVSLQNRKAELDKKIAEQENLEIIVRLCLRRLAMSWSKRGRISRQNSMTVTSQPKLLKTEANSRPITPPPMMQSRPGRDSSSKREVESRTCGRVMPGMSGITGTEPVAMMI